MDRIGLTFDEYVDMKLRPPVGADRVFHQAAEMERDAMFLMTTPAASTHLRSRGYDCRPAMLDLLVKNGVVKLAQPDAWRREDVDVAAEHFEECEMFVPYAAMCQTLGYRYIDFLRPLREAAERESAKYGRAVPDSDTGGCGNRSSIRSHWLSLTNGCGAVRDPVRLGRRRGGHSSSAGIEWFTGI